MFICALKLGDNFILYGRLMYVYLKVWMSHPHDQSSNLSNLTGVFKTVLCMDLYSVLHVCPLDVTQNIGVGT